MDLVYLFEHACPPDTGDGGCPVVGEQVMQRPTVLGSYYLLVPVRCAYTHHELKLVDGPTSDQRREP